MYLVYEHKGQPEIFEVDPRYIKNKKFSAKILKTNRSRSFAFSMMLGLFENHADAKTLLAKLKKMRIQSDRPGKEYSKCEDKLERLQNQIDNLEERVDKKAEVIADLEERASYGWLTEKQSERLTKANLNYSALEEKAKELYAKMDDLSELIDSNSIELDNLQEEEIKFLNEINAKCISKLHGLGIEDLTEAQPEMVVITPPNMPAQSSESKPTLIKKILGIFTRKK